MFGTIIIDAYKKEEVIDIAEAIEGICSPTDNYGWASAGIYCFWDYYTKEILYLGLAADLGERFKQHNGIISINESSCKINQIQEYFSKKEKLGYSIFVQSPMSQPVTHRNQENYRKWLDVPEKMPIENYVGEEGKENIKKIEGQLIEAFRIVNNDIPSWNKVSGSIFGQKSATKNNYYQIVKDFAFANMNNILISRSSLRELNANPTYTSHEENLHGIRMMMLSLGFSFEESLEYHRKNNPYYTITYGRIEEEKYLEKILEI